MIVVPHIEFYYLTILLLLFISIYGVTINKISVISTFLMIFLFVWVMFSIATVYTPEQAEKTMASIEKREEIINNGFEIIYNYDFNNEEPNLEIIKEECSEFIYTDSDHNEVKHSLKAHKIFCKFRDI